MVLDAGDFDDFVAKGLRLFDQVSGSEFVFRKGVNIRNGFAARGFADEFYFVAFNIFDAEDVELGEEVQ